jgi:hypothetical protein
MLIQKSLSEKAEYEYEHKYEYDPEETEYELRRDALVKDGGRHGRHRRRLASPAGIGSKSRRGSTATSSPSVYVSSATSSSLRPKNRRTVILLWQF